MFFQKLKCFSFQIYEIYGYKSDKWKRRFQKLIENKFNTV